MSGLPRLLLAKTKQNTTLTVRPERNVTPEVSHERLLSAPV